MLSLVVVIIFVALVFDFINGFHDAANSIATVVSTRVLTPLQAVVWAAFFNFVAAFGFGVSVARDGGQGRRRHRGGRRVGDPGGARRRDRLGPDHVVWGLPTSSSHALIGGFAGAAVVKAGFGSLVASGLLKIGAFMILAPLIGLVVGFAMMVLVDQRLQERDARTRRQVLPPRSARSRRPPTAWATAPTTPRRRWGSSRCCSSPPATSAPSSTCPSGSSSRRTPRSAWARWRAAGAS